jgi:chemotaxis response regulator CheB
MGASAGGVEALTALLDGLPGDLPAAIAVVLHRSPFHETRLPWVRRFPTMPRRAIAEDDVDAVLTLDGIARAPVDLAGGRPIRGGESVLER